MLQGTRFQVQVLKPYKSVRESSEEVLTANIYRSLKGYLSPILDSCLIDRVSIEIYENQIFNSDFHPIHE